VIDPSGLSNIAFKAEINIPKSRSRWMIRIYLDNLRSDHLSAGLCRFVLAGNLWEFPTPSLHLCCVEASESGWKTNNFESFQASRKTLHASGKFFTAGV
jgi:hypothetical protein